MGEAVAALAAAPQLTVKVACCRSDHEVAALIVGFKADDHAGSPVEQGRCVSCSLSLAIDWPLVRIPHFHVLPKVNLPWKARDGRGAGLGSGLWSTHTARRSTLTLSSDNPRAASSARRLASSSNASRCKSLRLRGRGGGGGKTQGEVRVPLLEVAGIGRRKRG